MSIKIIKTLLLGFILFTFQSLAKAQNDPSVEKPDRNIIVVGAGKTLNLGGKVTYLVIKETAKIAWKTTKFSAGEVAAPIAKAIVVKATPKVSFFILKQTGLAAKKVAPIALKAAITYLKL